LTLRPEPCEGAFLHFEEIPLRLLSLAFAAVLLSACSPDPEPSSEESFGEVLQSATCGGVTGFPVDPATGAAVCPPYNRPAVFFSPHQDDETLGMAGAIYEHVQAGRDVFIELMTDGSRSGARTVLGNGGTDTWHSGTHSYALTYEQFSEARDREFRAAAIRLGVKGIYLGTATDGALTQAQVAERIQWWRGGGFTGLSLKGTVGAEDPGSVGGAAHPDHAAVWNALVASGFADVRGYLVYHHTTGVGTPDGTITLTAAQCSAKRAALNEYKVWSPGAGRYAVGYHSVAQLIDSTYSSCREYIEYP
jgi:hypothetical protein